MNVKFKTPKGAKIELTLTENYSIDMLVNGVTTEFLGIERTLNALYVNAGNVSAEIPISAIHEVEKINRKYLDEKWLADKDMQAAIKSGKDYDSHVRAIKRGWWREAQTNT